MADNTDTATRLAQGKPAVDTIAEYVLACGMLGYHHQDLTRHPGQVHNWYTSEDGLDLRALDAQGAALGSAAAAADHALQLHESQLHNLSGVWQGSGALASHDFLLRHSASASQAASGLRSAVETLAELQDKLWRAVDAKVAATVEIEGRRAGRRGDWLTAARAVTTGLGDRAGASELLDQQVKPFVANDIGGDWLTAMRASAAAVSDAYDAAVTALRGGAVPVFDIPGDLGPVRSRAFDASPNVSETRDSAKTVPVGFSPLPLPSQPIQPVVPSALPSWSAPASPIGLPVPSGEPFIPAAASAAPLGTTPELAASPGLGQGSALGGGLPGPGSGLSGFGQQLADLFGGLIGSAADGLPEADMLSDIEDPLADEGADELLDDTESDSDDPDPDDPDPDESDPDGPDPDEPEVTQDPGESEDGEEEEAEKEEEPVGADSVAEPTEQQPVSPEPPAPELAPPPPAPMAAPLAGATPCDIAADELPQVGG